MRELRRIVLAIVICTSLQAHEGGAKDRKPAKAQKDLKNSARLIKSAKAKLAAQGRYQCCVRPSCDLCARTTGSCNCARNVAAGRGACGECYAGWLAGRGVVKGVDAKSVTLMPADLQSCPIDATAPAPPSELQEAVAALLSAKRTLVAEKRFYCCIRGGCGQCATEASCPCGQDLAAHKGVCGDCLDGWRSGRGSFTGIPAREVTLAAMDSMDASMGPGGGQSSGWYSSGTSQEPRSAPMEMLTRRAGNWTLMGNGTFFGVYSGQTGPRGRDKTFSTNWFMGIASHRLGLGALTFRSMLSLEPATITGRRYPLLFASGETAHGVPIINGQHPHDFFMELAASYQIPLGEKTALNFYGGPRGEPALGPPAFPRRLSASEDPVAVISHHLQDSTHISSNVFTAGITHGLVTWEVSGFHGREPGEDRWGLDSGGIDFAFHQVDRHPGHALVRAVLHRTNQPARGDPPPAAVPASHRLRDVRAPLAEGHWATSLV